MKIAVVGAGAMGSVYAGLLAEGGHEVWAVDRWAEHMDAIRAKGLHLEGASGDRVIVLNAATDPGDVGACDLVVLATKAAQVEAAAKSLGPLLRPDTPVLTIQNGLGSPERLYEVLGSENILVGVAGGFGASVRGPGHVHHNGMELVRLGERQGPVTPRLQEVASVWEGAGFKVKVFDDIAQLIWEKFVCNVTFSGPCTVLERPVGEIVKDPNAWKVALGCGLEAYEAGRAKGVNFSFDDAPTYILDFAAKIPNARPSMLLDYLAKRPSEIDFINGMVPVVAAEVGTRAPMNEVVVSLVKAKESSFV